MWECYEREGVLLNPETSLYITDTLGTFRAACMTDVQTSHLTLTERMALMP